MSEIRLFPAQNSRIVVFDPKNAHPQTQRSLHLPFFLSCIWALREGCWFGEVGKGVAVEVVDVVLLHDVAVASGVHVRLQVPVVLLEVGITRPIVGGTEASTHHQEKGQDSRQPHIHS